MPYPGAILVAHPVNPVYLLPLVEVVAAPATAPATVTRVTARLTELGMFPLLVRKEIDGHITDRFRAALWREALWLVRDGIATTAEIDEAIRMGIGLHWGQMAVSKPPASPGAQGGCGISWTSPAPA